MGAIVSIICCVFATYNFETEALLESMFPMYPERSTTSQIMFQVYGMLCTWGIAIPAGCFGGFVCKCMLPAPEELFDDCYTMQHVEYGDDLEKYNPFQKVEQDDKEKDKEE